MPEYTTIPTYADIIKVVEHSKESLFVAVFYKKGSHEWLPVDKTEFLRQLKGISKPESYPYPATFQVENDGQMFIHPMGEGQLLIHKDATETLDFVKTFGKLTV